MVTPPRLSEDGGMELTDLFLDLWVSPDLGVRYSMKSWREPHAKVGLQGTSATEQEKS
jgi:hypothetical protein